MGNGEIRSRLIDRLLGVIEELIKVTLSAEAL